MWGNKPCDHSLWFMWIYERNGLMARILRSTTALRALWSPPCNSGMMVRLQLWAFPGTTIVVDKRTVPAWMALNAIFKKYGYQLRRDDTGAFVCRKITNGDGYSLHAYGIAADFNWGTNGYYGFPIAKDGHSDMPDAMIQEIRNLRTKGGHWVFGWGGDYNSIRDFMHFEIVASPAELATGINYNTAPPPLTAKEKLYWFIWSGKEAKKKPFLDVGFERNPKMVPFIKQAQDWLGIPQTGTYGAKTIDAVKDFQAFFKIKHGGRAGRMNRATWQWLIYAAITKGRR